VLYWTRSSRTQFGVSINVWRLAGDTLNITCNFLYCNHQVHRDFLITLYILYIFSPKPSTMNIISLNSNQHGWLHPNWDSGSSADICRYHDPQQPRCRSVKQYTRSGIQLRYEEHNKCSRLCSRNRRKHSSQIALPAIVSGGGNLQIGCGRHPAARQTDKMCSRSTAQRDDTSWRNHCASRSVYQASRAEFLNTEMLKESADSLQTADTFRRIWAILPLLRLCYFGKGGVSPKEIILRTFSDSSSHFREYEEDDDSQNLVSIADRNIM
jgi:hypothetical protein